MSEPPISRGFRGRKTGGASSRIPPGQHLVSDFPVLSAGPTPEADLKSWRLTLEDGDSPVGEWTWAEFNALPQTDLTVDIHCVTTWSKLDTNWRGVTIDTLLEAAGLTEPPAPFVLGFVLGPLLEENLRRALLFSRGDPTTFLQSPISVAFLLATLVFLAAMALPNLRKRKDEAIESE